MRIGPATKYICAVALLGVLDGVLLWFLPRALSPTQSLWLTGYLVGQRVFVALLFASLEIVWSRLGRRAPRWLSWVLIFVASAALAHALFRRDFAGQREAVKPLLTALVAAVPTAMAAVRARFPWNARLRGAFALVALALTAGNHSLLPLNYPGFHVACLALSTLALGLAMGGERERSLGRDQLAVALVSAPLAVWAVSLRPSTSLASALGTQDALSLFRFTARQFTAAAISSRPPDLGPFWRRRQSEPDVAAGPALLKREDLIVALITIDALRYDVASGATEAKLNTLRALDAESVFFTRAEAPAASTTRTLSAIFSGIYSPQAPWVPMPGGRGLVPNVSTPSFPALLVAHQVQTLSLPSMWRLLAGAQAVRGFEREYRPRFTGFRYSDELLTPLSAWLEQRVRANERAFGYVHLIDAHGPYDRAGKEGSDFERYQREIEFVDRSLSGFIRRLKASGAWEKTVLIVSADHGEAFGEHGQFNHGGWLYEELTHVPLWIRVPGRGSRRVDEPVTLIDLGPTILDLFGVPTPGFFMGQTLVPLLRGEPARFQRPVAMHETEQGGLLFSDGIKVLYRPLTDQAEVYDLRRDPGEVANLADQFWVRDRIESLRRFFGVHEFGSARIWK